VTIVIANEETHVVSEREKTQVVTVGSQGPPGPPGPAGEAEEFDTDLVLLYQISKLT
jgi:hypothetical protein